MPRSSRPQERVRRRCRWPKLFAVLPSPAPSDPGAAADPVIRPATRADWQDIVRLSLEAFGASAWPWKRWRDLLTAPPVPPEEPVQAMALVGLAPPPAVPPLAGFIVLQMIRGEVEIQALAVSRSHRRQGWGGRLLAAGCERARTAQCHTALLEVRLGNAAAQAFYGRHGFSPCGRRSHYYHSPTEDALLMRKSLVPVADDAGRR